MLPRAVGYCATTGLCIERGGINRAEDINLVTKSALLNVIDHLVQIAALHACRLM